MTIISGGRPGQDDEFEVDIEDGALDDGLPTSLADELIDDAKGELAEVSNLPPDLEDEIVDGDEPKDDNDEADAGDDASEPVDDRDARIAAAEERALRAEVQNIYIQGDAALKFHEQQMNASKVALDSLDVKLENALSALAQARETGDTALELRLERSVRDMEGLKAEIAKARNEMPSREQIVQHHEQLANRLVSERRSQAAPKGKIVGAGIQANVPMAEKWANANGWMKTNKAANDFVVNASKGMMKEGWDMNTPGFYAELTRRTSRAFPNLKVSAIQATKKGISKGGVKTPVAPGRSSAGGAVQRQPQKNPAKYTLNSADVAAMRRMRLDPKDPIARREFAASRIESSRKSAGF